MSNYNDDHSETPYGRLIREAKEEAFHARRQLRREQPSPTPVTKREVATALADYYDVLSDYAGERALETPWGERLGVDMDALLTNTTTVDVPVFESRNKNATEKKEMPAVINVGAQDLIAIGKELDKIAKELGFAASAKQPTPHEEASMSDLRGLLKARGQTEALKNLPEGDEEDDAEAETAVTDGGEEE